MTREALERADQEASQPHEREHVTPYIYTAPGAFVLQGHDTPDDLSVHRWTVDTADDLQLARELYALFGVDGPAGWRDVLAALSRRPDLTRINAHVEQKQATSPNT